MTSSTTTGRKGFLLAVGAALSLSNIYVFSKAALIETPLFTFGFYWFSMALLYNIILSTASGKLGAIASYSPRSRKALIFIGLLEMLSTFSFFAAIRAIDNPAVVSFLVNTTPVFVTLMSIPFLRDRFTAPEIIGICITLSGAFILSCTGCLSFRDFFIKGAEFAIISCALAAAGIIIAKRNITFIDAYILSLNRVVFILMFFTAGALISKSSFHISLRSFLNIAAGSFFGPFVAAILQYKSYSYIKASHASLIQNTNGLFVIIGVFFFFGVLPEAHQITGGLITIAGVMLMVYGRDKTGGARG